MRLERPEPKQIRQGALFNCFHIAGLEQWPCHAILLTARCDIAQDKHSVFNCLPVIPFDAWVRTEMPHKLAKKNAAKCTERIKAELRKARAPETHFDSYRLEELIERYIIPTKQKEALMEQFSSLSYFNKIVNLDRGVCDEPERLYSKLNADVKQVFIRDLINQQHADYYFLESADVDEASNLGHVVLLRHMVTFPPNLLRAIANDGVHKSQIDQHHRDKVLLTFSHVDECMITGVLRSPDIEHLSQAFGHLFTRIGLPDQSIETVNKHFLAFSSVAGKNL